jgi:23S rRNA (guanosine2251-2'-O)-methyltransferase
MHEVTLVLHNIRSTHNVGSIFRTAEGFAVKEIILTGYTPYPAYHGDIRLPHISEKITKQIHKTALGAETLVPFRHYETIEEFLTTTTLPLIALEQADRSVHLPDFSTPERFALLLGEEVHGIEPSLLEKCTAVIEIPMKGRKESFNVSVATGIALYGFTVGAESSTRLKTE